MEGEENLLVDIVLFLSSYSVTSVGAVSYLVDHGEETNGCNLTLQLI